MSAWPRKRAVVRRLRNKFGVSPLQKPTRAYSRRVPRPPRIAPAGGIFHITARGNRRQLIFLDDDDRRWLLRLFGAAVARFRWTCHAYCLMGNHLHLLIELSDESLSGGMQWLLGRYAQDFNWRHDVDGHLFQGRFKSETVESNWHLLELSRYIANNPVRAGLCETAADWTWSSYQATLGTVPVPGFLTVDWLLAQFGQTVETRRAAYAVFVAEGADRARPWRTCAFQPWLGSDPGQRQLGHVPPRRAASRRGRTRIRGRGGRRT